MGFQLRSSDSLTCLLVGTARCAVRAAFSGATCGRDSRLTRGSFRPLCGRDIEFCPRSSSSWRVFEGEAKPISTNLKVEIRTGINLPKSLFTAILVDADKSFPTDHFIAFLVGEADDT